MNNFTPTPDYPLMNKSSLFSSTNTNLPSFILKTLLGFFLYWFLLWIFVDKSDARISLFTHTLAALFSTLVYTHLLFRNTKFTTIVCLIFALKMGIGLWHYFTFINPDYFSTPSAILLHSEFQVYFDTISNFANDKTTHGLFYTSDNFLLVSHPELLNIISVVFRYTGNYVLTIAPLNTLSSIYMALGITYVAKHMQMGNLTKYVLFFCLFFPISLISSFFFRDMFGMMLMTIGVVCVVLAKKSKFILLIIASLFFYLQRTPYVIIPFAAFALSEFTFLGGNKRSINSSFVKYSIGALMIVFVVVLLPFLSSLTDANAMYLSIFSNIIAIVLFPVKFIVGLIGPFPWSQWSDSLESTYQLQDYLLAVTLCASFWHIVPAFIKQLKIKAGFDFITLTGLLIVIMGVMNPFMTVGYIGEGLPFLAPFLLQIVSPKAFAFTFIKVLFLFLLANMVFIAFGLRGIGLGLLFK